MQELAEGNETAPEKTAELEGTVAAQRVPLPRNAVLEQNVDLEQEVEHMARSDKEAEQERRRGACGRRVPHWPRCSRASRGPSRARAQGRRR